jgi:hypothetical protein
MMSRNVRRLASVTLVSLGLAVAAAPKADAFCGFYVGGAGAKLFNDATVVVLMREGTRTVLSMQNAYKGPPEKFAMVVPVPVVLQEENVKTLPRDLFDKVDQLAAPRLVEYWEQDPCAQEVEYKGGGGMRKAMAPAPAAARAEEAADLGVKIEAQFTVGEYQVVVLSAKDSGGLEEWLHREQYTIPDGAAPYFKPYVAAGSKFFVARVDINKVKMEDGVAVLSPLRFYYDSETFSLPVRLGLINSSGTQDLIVHVLARGKRYEVANYPNVTIPTNLDVSEAAKTEFPTFYTTLFDRTLEKHAKAVVTEYSWDSSSCDPCPGPALTPNDLATLGADVLPGADGEPPPPPIAPTPVPVPAPQPTLPPKGGPGTKSPTGALPPSPPSNPAPPSMARSMPRPRRFFGGGGFTITRLHARYTKESLGEDLVFKEAPAIMGGREVMGPGGKLETGAKPSGYMNNFQARYAVRHPWTGPIDCKEPRRGVWGGPPGGGSQPTIKAAQRIGLAPRVVKADLASFVKSDVPEIGFSKVATDAPPSTTPESATPGAPAAKKGCAGCTVTPREDAGMFAGLAAALGALVTFRLRRRGRRP